MKSKTAILLSALTLFICGTLNGQDNVTGDWIAQKVHDSNRSSSGLVLKGSMVMKNIDTGSSEIRKSVMLAVTEGVLTKGIFRFTDSSYSGTTMLTLERSGQDNLQYLYLPSVGSPRQIESSDREKNFVDTDFSNEDLGGSKISDYTYKRLPDQKYRDYDCYVIERTPKNKSSKYSKHVVIIDKGTMIPVNVQFYGKSGRVIKTMNAGQIKKISGRISLPMYIEIIDLEKRHQTAFGISEAQEKNLNRGYFNRNRMNMKWAEE